MQPAHLHMCPSLSRPTQPNSNATMRNRRSATEDRSAASRRQQWEEVVPSDYCKNITQACVVCTSPLCKSARARCSQSREGKGRSRQTRNRTQMAGKNVWHQQEVGQSILGCVYRLVAGQRFPYSGKFTSRVFCRDKNAPLAW